jgi:hypothetical protein
MNAPVRNQWIAMLESVAQGSPDAVSSEWSWILERLKLPLEFFPYVSEAIQQGRWRTADNPKSYIRKVAWRESTKAEREFEDSNPLKPVALPADGSLSMEDALEHFGYLSDTAEAIQHSDGVWRRGGIPRYDVDEDEYETVTDRLLSQIPQSAKQLVEPPDEYKAAVEQFNNSTTEYHTEERAAVAVDLREWGRLAGLSEWECTVFGYRASGVSRDRALSEQPDEQSRKALQAAWRKFDRTGMSRLRAVAKEKSDEDVPE